MLLDNLAAACTKSARVTEVMDESVVEELASIPSGRDLRHLPSYEKGRLSAQGSWNTSDRKNK